VLTDETSEESRLDEGEHLERLYGRDGVESSVGTSIRLERQEGIVLPWLWQRQGKRAAARALLAPLYAWFSEGFATRDLIQAKTLLETL
jgi:hypothetical protein